MDVRLIILAATFALLIVSAVSFVSTIVRGRRMRKLAGTLQQVSEFPTGGFHAVDTNLEGLDVHVDADAPSASLLTPLRRGEWKPPQTPAPPEELPAASLAGRIASMNPIVGIREPVHLQDQHEDWMAAPVGEGETDHFHPVLGQSSLAGLAQEAAVPASVAAPTLAAIIPEVHAPSAPVPEPAGAAGASEDFSAQLKALLPEVVPNPAPVVPAAVTPVSGQTTLATDAAAYPTIPLVPTVAAVTQGVPAAIPVQPLPVPVAEAVAPVSAPVVPVIPTPSAPAPASPTHTPVEPVPAAAPAPVASAPAPVEPTHVPAPAPVAPMPAPVAPAPAPVAPPPEVPVTVPAQATAAVVIPAPEVSAAPVETHEFVAAPSAPQPVVVASPPAPEPAPAPAPAVRPTPEPAAVAVVPEPVIPPLPVTVAEAVPAAAVPVPAAVAPAVAPLAAEPERDDREYWEDLLREQQLQGKPASAAPRTPRPEVRVTAAEAPAPEPQPVAQEPVARTPRPVARVRTPEGTMAEFAPTDASTAGAPPRAPRKAPEIVMEAPVEMWFGESRVGVKAGTATYDRFRKYADVLLSDLHSSKAAS